MTESNQESRPDMDEIVSLCKRRGFIFQSSEIYGGMAGAWDYGPLGRGTEEQHQASVVEVGRAGTRRHGGHGRGYPDAPAGLGGQRARGDVRGPDGRLPELSGAASGPTRSRGTVCPNCGAEGQLTEPRMFNLLFKTFAGPVENEASIGLSAAGDGAGDVRQLRERAGEHASQAAVRDGADREVVPQRGHPAALHLPDAGVRADGDRVLRAAAGGGALASSTGWRSGCAGTSTWASGRRTCGCTPTPRRTWRTTPPPARTWSTSSRWAGWSWRASRTARTSTCSSTARRAA